MTSSSRRLLALVFVSTVFGLGHHVDHVVRGNHVGWPLVPKVTPFTVSLAIYPLIAVGIWLEVRDRGGPGYWMVVAWTGFLLVVATHFGPQAVEPPGDVIGPYESQLVGLGAFIWLVVFTVVLGVTAGYATARWWRAKSTRGRRKPVPDDGDTAGSQMIRNLCGRRVQRSFHLVCAVALGTFLYSPLRTSATATVIVQLLVFPTLAVSGLWLWKGGRIRARLRPRAERR